MDASGLRIFLGLEEALPPGGGDQQLGETTSKNQAKCNYDRSEFAIYFLISCSVSSTSLFVSSLVISKPKTAMKKAESQLPGVVTLLEERGLEELLPAEKSRNCLA
jgi:hypothetical protein